MDPGVDMDPEVGMDPDRMVVADCRTADHFVVDIDTAAGHMVVEQILAHTGGTADYTVDYIVVVDYHCW